MSNTKEHEILELFFNEPTKHWRFKELKVQVTIADNKLSKWLKKFQSQKLVKKIKPIHSLPVYVSLYQSANFQNKKRMYGLNKLYQVGLLNHLTSLKELRTVILFGSFSRWDWHRKSDIDIFVVGNDDFFEKGKYELLLHREIQLITCKTNDDIGRIGNVLMKNIIKGVIIKGDIDFLEVKINA